MSSASPPPEPSTGKPKWAGKSRGTPLGYRIFIFLIRHVGLGAAYALLVPVAAYYVVTAREPGRAWLRFLRRAHPEYRMSDTRALFKAYYTFGQLLIDKVTVMGGLRDRITTRHIAERTLQGIMDSGRGGLLISGHIGNWQLASYMMKRYRGQVSVVMLDAERDAIKQVMEEATTDRRFEVIPLQADMSHLFRIRGAFAEGRLVCIHGDRALGGSRTASHPFLGHPAEFPLGPFAIAAAFDVPVCFSFVVRTGPRTYTFTATDPLPPDRDPRVHLARYVAELERIARTYPWQWGNFYDFWTDDQRTIGGTRRRDRAAAPPPAHGAGA